MDHATLQIEVVPGAVRCVWAPPCGPAIARERYVHADDLESAETCFDTPPTSPGNLELIGTRIFSRLLDREVRQAVFTHPQCAVLLETNTPRVPWELAFGNGRFLFEAHALGRGPDSPAGQQASVLSVLIVANPTGDLEWSVGEAAQISERLKHAGRVQIDTLVGASATRDAVLSALETRPYSVLHFSCHAEYNAASPDRSRLFLFDGPVEARELYHTAISRPPRLCVLNACESGKTGDTERISGLASAFRALGATTVIGARWPVNNKSSAFWMSHLYAGLVGGKSVGEAASEAQVETRRLFSNDPLLTWAAFAVYGAPWTYVVEAGGPVPIGQAPLVGRDRQWAALETAWRAAQAGRGSVVAIIGPSGSGKTRLLEDFISSLPPGKVMTLDLAQDCVGAGDCKAVWIDGLDECDVRRRLTFNRIAAGASARSSLVIATARDALALGVPPESFTALTLPPLAGNELNAIFESLGGTPPPGLREATPGEAERLALGVPRADSVEVFVNALPENARTVLRAGAVWGTQFLATQVNDLVELPRPDLWRALESLCSDHWIVESSPGHFEFRDPSDREAVLNAFRPRGERAEWERHAAEICAEAGATEEAGQHWESSGDLRASIVAFTQAFHDEPDAAGVLRLHTALLRLGAISPDHARVAAAYGETGRWLESRQWWERVVADAPTGEALLGLAEACLRCGDTSSAERHLRAAKGLAAPDALSTAYADFLLNTGKAQLARTQAHAAALDALDHGDPLLAARAALVWAQAALLLARADDAVAACELGLGAGPDPRVSAALGRSMAQARQFQGDYPAAESALRSLANPESSALNIENRIAALLALAELCRDQGRLSEAHRVLDEAASLGLEVGHAALGIEASNVRSSVLRREGRYEEALRAAETAQSSSVAAGLGPEAIRARIHVGTALTEMGWLADARTELRQAWAAADRAGYVFGAAWSTNVMGLAALEAGDIDAAESALTDSRSLAKSIHGHIGVAGATHLLAWCAWESGQAAASQFERAEKLATRTAYRAVLLSSRFGAAICRDDIAASDNCLRELEALNMGAVLPWLREKRGRWFLAQRRYEEALRDLAPACRVARRLGMRALQGRAASALASVYDAMDEQMADAMRREGDSLTAECLAGWRDVAEPGELST